MADLRAGLVGLGQMGRHHARVLQSTEGVRLVAIADPDADRRALDVPLVKTVEELVELGIDMAVVASPTFTHEGIGLFLAENGVHTLIEKPLAHNVAAARRLADVFADAGLVGCVGHIERYNPALQELRRRLAAGDLGEIYQIATRRQGPFPARIADVGVVLDLASHDIDLTSWVAKSRYTSVTAHVAHRSGRSHEDLVAAIGTLENGVVVNHLVNWLSPLKERVTIVNGERGSLVADTMTADLTFYANGVAPIEWEEMQSFRGVVQGDVIRYAIAKPEPLAVEVAAFRDAVLGVRKAIVTMRDATRVVAVAQGMLLSAETGKAVNV